MTPITSSTDAYTRGRETAAPFMNAYVEGTPVGIPITNAQGCYMNGGGFTSFHLAYVQTISTVLDTQECFVSGFSLDEQDHKGALRFESINQQYVQVPSTSEYDNMSAFTINMWVKARTDSNLIYQGLVVKEGVFESWVQPTGNSFGMKLNIGGSFVQGLTLSFAKNDWYMLTCTYTGTGIHFYRNGAEFYSTNVTGAVATNTNDWFFGRYPSKSTYSDVDLSKVSVYNYALTSGEVAALFTPPSRCSHLPCYIPVETSNPLSSVRRAYVVNTLSNSNPGVLAGSQGCCIATDATHGFHKAYIVAGGESTTVYDNRIFTRDRQRVVYDNLIVVHGNIGRFDELQLGNVVYPITRDAVHKLRIRTSFDPDKLTDSQDCWLQTHFSEESSRGAYVVAVQAESRAKSIYLHGDFTAINSNKNCYITNISLESSHALYVAGITVFHNNYQQNCYLNGFADNATDTLGAFVYGKGPLTASKLCYVPAPAFTGRALSAFIMSTVSAAAVAMALYLKGNVGIQRSHNAYIAGHYASTVSHNAYVTAIPQLTVVKLCFIQSENPIKVSKHTHVHGRQPVTTSKLCYIRYDVASTSVKSSFVRGSTSVLRSKLLYVQAQAVTTTSSPTGFGAKLGFSPGAAILSDSQLAQDIALMKNNGAQWVRLDCFDNGNTNLDSVVTSFVNAGINVTMIINSGSSSTTTYASTCTTVVNRYKVKGVHTFELGNEPNGNSSGFGGGLLTATQYSALVKAGYPAVKAADPTAFVLAGGLQPASSTNDPVTWVQTMYAQGCKGFFDAISIHPYCYPNLPSQSATWSTWTKMETIHNVMVSNADSSPIWATEFGVPTYQTYTEAFQRDSLNEAVTKMKTTHTWLAKLFWYNHRDDGVSTTNDQWNFGAVKNNFTPKLMLASFRAAALAPTASKMCFLVNNVPISSKFAFINSAPQSNHSCYIVSAGTSTRIKSAHVVA